MKLNYSDVIFYEDAHIYVTPDGRQLSGVTALLSRQMFARKYDGISKSVLNKAAHRGSAIHEQIEFFDSIGGKADTPELEWYEKIKAQYGLVPLANEYLVSDNEYLASSIDVVYEDMTLADIKTTSKLDIDYLSWQLSIYAYLFERQNEGAKIKRLLAIWIPKEQYGKPSVVEIPRIGDARIVALIEADKKGAKYIETVAETAENLPITQQAIEEVKIIIADLDSAKKRYNELKEGMLGLMREHGCKKFEQDGLSMSFTQSYEKESFDLSAFKADHPELYAQYLKTTTVKDSLTLKLK